jgi:DNA-binding SARP family transcriptional activator
MLGQALSAMPPIRQRDEMPHAPAAGVRLALLRGFELTRNGVCVPLSSGLQHLLAYLALHRRALRRTQVAGILWDDVTDRRAAGNLRSALWRLKHLGVDLVGSANQQLSLSAGVAVDIWEADRIARLALDPTTDATALNLEDLPITGELLPGWDQEWVLLERERQRQIGLHVLDALCERWTQTAQYDKAIRAGLAAIATEPLHESSHRALIGAFLAEGNPAEAIRRYREFRDSLWTELHIEPSARITEMVAGLSGR